MAQSGADVEQCEALSAPQAGASARTPTWRSPVRLGMAAACLIAAAVLLAFPGGGAGSKGAGGFVEWASIISKAQTEDAPYDKLLSMIKENNATLPGMIQEVTDLVQSKHFSEVAKKAIEIQKLMDQNERNQKLHDLVLQTRDAMLDGNYTESKKQLNNVINEKCTALTKTEIAGLKIQLKQGLDQEDWDDIHLLAAQLEPLQKRCDEKAASLGVIKNASRV